MPISQNLKFNGTVPKDEEFEHPLGADLIRKIESKLKSKEWKIRTFDNWRDCGWILVCKEDNAEMEIVISAINEQEWMLQVTATYNPGLIGRLLKKKSSASESSILKLAQDVHDIIDAEKSYDNFMWCWDDFPDKHNSTSKPEAYI